MNINMNEHNYLVNKKNKYACLWWKLFLKTKCSNLTCEYCAMMAALTSLSAAIPPLAAAAVLAFAAAYSAFRVSAIEFRAALRSTLPPVAPSTIATWGWPLFCELAQWVKIWKRNWWFPNYNERTTKSITINLFWVLNWPVIFEYFIMNLT